MLVRLKRRLIRSAIVWLTSLFIKVRVHNGELISESSGKAIVVSNHLGRIDAALCFKLVPREDMIMVVAEKYQEVGIFRWLVKQLDLLWLDRFEADLGTLKEVLRRLAKGGILMVAPEGTRSQTEALLEGKPGAAYLAAKSGAPVIPAAVLGSEDRLVKGALRSFRRPEVNIYVGEPFEVPALPRQGRDEFLRQQTDEIMAHIAILLPESHRGVYKGHPRVHDLLFSG